MKSIFKNVKASLLFYLFLFGIHLVLYFSAPSFYISSTKGVRLPPLIVIAILKYLALFFVLYLIWALLTGFLNGILFLRIGGKTSSNTEKFFLLSLSQFLILFLFLTLKYPSILFQYPLFRELPLGLNYGIFVALALLLGFLFIKTLQDNFAGNWVRIASAWLLPTALFYYLTLPSKLNFPSLKKDAQGSASQISILGFDALDGDSGNGLLADLLTHEKGVLFTNAFTPIPLTHPAWNSILSGLYPKNHSVRYFFNSPLKSKYPGLFLPKLLRDLGGYRSLFASNQPETSYFDKKNFFDEFLLKPVGWEAHLFATLMNRLVLPAVWLNNPWIEKITGHSYNYSNLFNSDLSRFYNYSFENLEKFGNQPKLLALHSCPLHSPIYLDREELKEIKHYLFLSPRMFSFWKWPRPGEPQSSTPSHWKNPYLIRRKSTLAFLRDLIGELKMKGYFDRSTVIILSDHGERFVKDREIYGGIHGVDLETREQNNVVLAIMDPSIPDFHHTEEPVNLVDITPTLLSLLGYETNSFPFDGLPLLNKHGRVLSLPRRPIWAESMGYINDAAEKAKFPQVSLKSLEESLIFDPQGGVTISKDYYQRILQKKQFSDLTKSPAMIRSTVKLPEDGAGSPSL